MLENFQGHYERGDLWWNMCWEPHAYRLTGRRNFVLAVNLDMEQLGSCAVFGGCNWLAPFVAPPGQRYRPRNPEERERVLELGRRLLHLYRKRENNWRISSWLLIHELLIFAINRMDWHSLGSTLDRESLNSFTRIRKVLEQIRENDSRAPSLLEAAEICSLSTSRFSEVFRRTMGVSYGKLVIRVRMTHAAKDLLSGYYSLEEIVQKWGFFDSAHFCHAFKKFYRVSPGKFVANKNGA